MTSNSNWTCLVCCAVKSFDQGPGRAGQRVRQRERTSRLKICCRHDRTTGLRKGFFYQTCWWASVFDEQITWMKFLWVKKNSLSVRSSRHDSSLRTNALQSAFPRSSSDFILKQQNNYWLWILGRIKGPTRAWTFRQSFTGESDLSQTSTRLELDLESDVSQTADLTFDADLVIRPKNMILMSSNRHS